MKTFYYATTKENTFSIMKEGIEAGDNGGVYLAENVVGALVPLYSSIRPGEYAVLPVYLSEDTVKPEKNGKYWFSGSISPDNVEKNLDNIPLFKIN